MHGRVCHASESDFSGYLPLRLTEMPGVEGSNITSTEAPRGIGELSVPRADSAVFNAFFPVVGRRITAFQLSIKGLLVYLERAVL